MPKQGCCASGSQLQSKAVLLLLALCCCCLHSTQAGSLRMHCDSTASGLSQSMDLLLEPTTITGNPADYCSGPWLPDAAPAAGV